MAGSYKSAKKGMRPSGVVPKCSDIGGEMHQGSFGHYEPNHYVGEEMHQGVISGKHAEYVGAAMAQGMSGAGTVKGKHKLGLKKHIPESDYLAHHAFGNSAKGKKKGKK